jgi:hypothetical protein
MGASLTHWVRHINRLVILLTFRHAGLDPASRNSLDSGACPGPRSGVRRNDIVVDNYEMVNNACTYQHVFLLLTATYAILTGNRER